MAGTNEGMKPRVVILKTGTTYPQIKDQFGDFEDWFVARLSSQLDLTIADVTQALPPGRPQDWHGVVITGSPAMVSDREPWSEQAAGWLKEAVQTNIPTFGVCYGHQLLAHALGGKVGYHPQGRETGTQNVTLFENAQTDPLFRHLPPQFFAQLTHKQSVLELPPEAVLLGATDFEPHQAFRVGNNAWGVQFHPEFSDDVMRSYLKVQQPELEKEGLNTESLLNRVSPAPQATWLLELFSEWVINKQRD
ncbi:glutamine amidotransferase [Marinobacter sp. AL4B]|uniref:glutamine amidotransferase n=1 Tax=Marinobacter sp. AL4B TaxID=2871173 RepID=UPI0021CD3509|nr:glutamine amidotransferase [Marinobacter sp. AL4B]